MKILDHLQNLADLAISENEKAIASMLYAIMAAKRGGHENILSNEVAKIVTEKMIPLLNNEIAKQN